MNRDQKEAFLTLLDAGADVNSLANVASNTRLLSYALVAGGSFHVLRAIATHPQVMIDAQVNVDDKGCVVCTHDSDSSCFQDSNGCTALDHAVFHCNHLGAAILLAANANPSVSIHYPISSAGSAGLQA